MENKFTEEHVKKIVSQAAEQAGMVKGAAITASGMTEWIASSIFAVVTSEEYKEYLHHANTQPSSNED